MKTNTSRTNWIIDAALFAGFVLSFLLDLTGVVLHQWLGLALGALIAYHLMAHRSWIEAVTPRFFGRTSGQSRIYYAIDIALLLGFCLILLTGLMISTWLALPLQNYLAWHNVHVHVSITTLLLVCLKIGMHWRWIVTVARRCIFVSPSPLKGGLPSKPIATPVSVGRRDFVKLMGLVGAAAVVATHGALHGLDRSSDQETDRNDVPLPASTPISMPQEDTAGAVPSKSCVARCDRHCSYPGRCRRYRDSNQSGSCDSGECI